VAATGRFTEVLGPARTRAAVAIALGAVVLAGAALRAERAADPRLGHESADERAYARIALNISEGGAYATGEAKVAGARHWAPAAPAAFAVANLVAPGGDRARDSDIPAAYWAQAVAGTATILAAFGVSALLVGALPGLLAAAAVAFYPPLIWSTDDLLSEPLGALLVTAAVLALVWAWERPPGWWRGPEPLRFLIPGAAFGAAALTRADLLLVPLLVAGLVAMSGWRRWGSRSSLASGAALAAGAALVVAPWTVSSSLAEERFVPVTTAGDSSLFVGTYLPGDGTMPGLRRELGEESGPRALDAVAARRPGLSRGSALRREGIENLGRYAWGRPGAFGGMLARKVRRMWIYHSRGGGAGASLPARLPHLALLAVALAGLLAGLWRTRDPRLGVILLIAGYATLLHAILVSQPRYALPLMPMLAAGGIAGIFIAARGGVPRAPQ
jgi:4-amino-4-deoxy-L-arabinose transferase-like glycosyltransferase